MNRSDQNSRSCVSECHLSKDKFAWVKKIEINFQLSNICVLVSFDLDNGGVSCGREVRAAQ
jgi:hypothetical protein